MRHGLLLLAALLLVVGVGLVSIPAGLIVAGLACGGFWWLLEDVDG